MVSPRWTAACALALTLAPAALPAFGAGKQVPPAPAAAHLSVSAGRVSLVQGDSVRVLTRASERAAVRGDAYAEVGALGAAELSWPGSASLKVRGPAALEWSPGGAVRVLSAERLELEVRRGVRELALPAGWSLRVERAAIGAEDDPRGDWAVEHRGGEDVALRRGDAAAGTLTSGSRALLSGR